MTSIWTEQELREEIDLYKELSRLAPLAVPIQLAPAP